LAEDAVILDESQANEINEMNQVAQNTLLGKKIRDIQRGVGQAPIYIKFDEDPGNDVPSGGAILRWNKEDYTFDIITGQGPVYQIAQEDVVIVYNGTGVQIDNLSAVYPIGAFGGRPSVALANSETHVKILGDVVLATMDIPHGSFGICTRFGKVRGVDTSSFPAGATLWVNHGAGNDGTLTETRPSFPNYAIQIGGVTVSDAVNGEVLVGIKGTPSDTVQNFFNATFRETIKFLVTSNGTTITGSLAPQNGHDDLTMIFSDGFTMLDTNPPKTITLTPGTDEVPVRNYVFIRKTSKVLEVSTTDFPEDVEHIKVADLVLWSATRTQSIGAAKNRNHNDHIEDTTSFQGHMSHICERLREEDAKWKSGVLGSMTISVGAPDDVYVAITSGIVYQLHRQSMPAIDLQAGGDIHVVNNFTTKYLTVTNLNGQILDANGTALSNRSFSFVMWGVANKSGEPSHIFLNLPVGSYAKNIPATAESDPTNYAVYEIPEDFKGTGFLIARFILTLDATGQTWVLYSTQDLRGKTPNQIAGGGGGSTDPFAIHRNEPAEITTITEKTSVSLNDWVLIEDSADSNNKKRVKVSNLLSAT
jgi:hypothetical protein